MSISEWQRGKTGESKTRKSQSTTSNERKMEKKVANQQHETYFEA